MFHICVCTCVRRCVVFGSTIVSISSVAQVVHNSCSQWLEQMNTNLFPAQMWTLNWVPNLGSAMMNSDGCPGLSSSFSPLSNLRLYDKAVSSSLLYEQAGTHGNALGGDAAPGMYEQAVVYTCDRCIANDKALKHLKLAHAKLAHERKVAIAQALMWKAKCTDLRSANQTLIKEHQKLGGLHEHSQSGWHSFWAITTIS